MTTVRDIVERAFRKIGVVATDESMTADQAQVGLDALNMMMHGWALEGVDIGHFDLLLADEFPMVPRFHEGAVYQLASRIAPDFSMQAFDVSLWMQQLRTAYLVIGENIAPSALLRMGRMFR